MSILPPAVLTVNQLVGGVVATAKTVRDLAKDTQNHDLKAAISDLYDDIIDVKARVLELDEENRALHAQLKCKDEFVGPVEPHGYFFYKNRPEEPLCPKCLQMQPSNAVFMSSVQSNSSNVWRRCIICSYVKYERPKQAAPTIRMARRSPWV